MGDVGSQAEVRPSLCRRPNSADRGIAQTTDLMRSSLSATVASHPPFPLLPSSPSLTISTVVLSIIIPGT